MVTPGLCSPCTLSIGSKDKETVPLLEPGFVQFVRVIGHDTSQLCDEDLFLK